MAWVLLSELGKLPWLALFPQLPFPMSPVIPGHIQLTDLTPLMGLLAAMALLEFMTQRRNHLNSYKLTPSR